MDRTGRIVAIVTLIVLGASLGPGWILVLHPNPKDNPPGTDGEAMAAMSIFLVTCGWVAGCVVLTALMFKYRRRK